MDERSFILFFIKYPEMIQNTPLAPVGDSAVNRAFLHGDAVKVTFFVRNGQLIMAEECYFFLMASMRKMRMNIPLGYTLDFFQNILTDNTLQLGIHDASVHMMVYRESGTKKLDKVPVAFHIDIETCGDVLQLHGGIELDLIKEISVNTHLLSNIRVHCPENIYAEIYARDNDLDDVILLNPNKRIARTVSGNLLFLEGNVIKIPKQSEGAYISPLMENLVTFIHKNGLAEIREEELIAFESQKSEEILLVSDSKGLYFVQKIRNKTFANSRFAQIIEQWQSSFQ